MNPDIVDVLKRIKEGKEQKFDTRNILYERRNKTYGFTKFKMIRAFAMKNNITTMYMKTDEQNQWAKSFREFKSETILSNPNMRKKYILNSATALFKERGIAYKAFESEHFHYLQIKLNRIK